MKRKKEEKVLNEWLAEYHGNLQERRCEKMLKRRGKFNIIIRIKSVEMLEIFIEKRIIPLKKKYPYADICIEVE